MKAKHVIILIAAIIVIDQILKFYIKLNFSIGEDIPIVGNWFHINFQENEGMAWGLQLGGSIGKIILTLFRFVAVIWGTFLLRDFILKGYHKVFIICVSMIYAGALGNLIDSLFYGLIFDTSFDQNHPELLGVVAKAFADEHYGIFLHGKVVDMLYFPLIKIAHIPTWIPFWGGEDFEFFRPVFNIADSSISIGVITLLILQKKILKQRAEVIKD